MAIYTDNGLAGAPSGFWFQTDVSTITSNTATRVALANGDGSFTILIGSGFVVTGGALTAGTITGMQRASDAAGTTVFETVTGLSYAATTFQSHVADANMVNIAGDIFAGADTLNGSAQNNFFRGYAGNDIINGGDGFDTSSYSGSSLSTGPIAVVMDATSTVTGNASVGTDTLNSIESVAGTGFADTYTVNAGFTASSGTFNEFEGFGGNDTITGNRNTRISFSNASAAVNVSITGADLHGTATGNGSVGTDTFTYVNAVLGSNFGDTMSAAGATGGIGQSNNGFIFWGRGGNDLITGGGVGNTYDFNISRYDNATAGIVVTLGATSTVTGDASVGTDTLVNVEQVRGGDFADTFTADSNFNGIYGKFNAFEGMGGNDTITGNGNTRVQFGRATAGVTVTLTGTNGSGTAVGDASVGTDTFVSGVNAVSGSAFNDTISAAGARGNFAFFGRGGNDTIIGGNEGINNFNSNQVRYSGATGAITALMNGATWTVTGDASIGTDTITSVESIRGSDFNDTFVVTNGFAAQFGGEATIDGYAGNDTITGNGMTRVSYGTALSGVNINLQTGTASSIAAADAANVGIDTFTGVNGAFGSDYGDIITGSNGAQAEILRGGMGNDTIDGGGGVLDVVDYRNSEAGVTVDLFAGTASDGFGGTDTLSNLEGVRGSEFNDTITGSIGADRISGQSGDDVINGGAGNDIIYGDDKGSQADLFDGAFGESVSFDSGNDTIDGGTGADVMYGGLGNDTYYVDDAGDVVTEGAAEGSADHVLTSLANYVLANNVEILEATGPAAAHVFTGNADNNTITTSAGNFADVIIGGAGIDTMTGGDGNDSYFVDNTADVIVEGAGVNSGYDVVTSTANYTLSANIEQLVLQGGATHGTGNDQANYLYGGNSGLSLVLDGAGGDDVLYAGLAGGNTLIGGSGVDTLLGYGGNNNMQGGLGSDIYFTYTASDVLSEAGGDGIDTVYSNHDITVGEGLEQIILFASATSATSTSATDNNIMYGNSTTGAVTLSGGGGADVLFGGAFADNLLGGDGVDLLFGNGGADTLTGGNDTDVYYLQSGTETVVETTTGGFDTAYTQVASTTLAANVEQLILYGAAVSGTGNSGDNYLYGHIAANAVTLDGQGGNDYLLDSAFSGDVLIGGTGNDLLDLRTGGNDSIKFAAGSGVNSVLGFDADPTGGQDLIDVSGRGFSAGSIGTSILISASGSDTLVTIGADTIRLFGVASANVTATDFVF